MKRSQIQGAVLLLVLLLVVAACLHRSSTSSRGASPLIRESEPAAAARRPEPPVPTATAPTQPVPPPSKTGSAVSVPAQPLRLPTVLIRGRLIDGQTRPVPLVKVEAFARNLAGTLNRSESESDVQGRFEFRFPEETRVTITAHQAGYGRGFTTVDARETGVNLFGELNEITLELRRSATFEGRILMPDGSAAAGARISFHPFTTIYRDQEGKAVGLNVLMGSIPPNAAYDEHCRKTRYLTDFKATTTEQGAFRAESLVAGVNYLIVVDRPGFPQAVLEAHVRSQKLPVVLQIPP